MAFQIRCLGQQLQCLLDLICKRFAHESLKSMCSSQVCWSSGSSTSSSWMNFWLASYGLVFELFLWLFLLHVTHLYLIYLNFRTDPEYYQNFVDHACNRLTSGNQLLLGIELQLSIISQRFCLSFRYPMQLFILISTCPSCCLV